MGEWAAGGGGLKVLVPVWIPGVNITQDCLPFFYQKILLVGLSVKFYKPFSQ